MEESVVKRFLEYEPFQSLEETEHTRTPSSSARQRPSTYSITTTATPQKTTTTRPHPLLLPAQNPLRPDGMAHSPSSAARPARNHTSSSTAEPSTYHQVPQPQPSPLPHPRPHSDPKAKFTLDDDALLAELKEQHEMTWKQIAEFFPGRSSGTLQVRYCTKLKAKGGAWTDELVNFSSLLCLEMLSRASLVFGGSVVRRRDVRM